MADLKNPDKPQNNNNSSSEPDVPQAPSRKDKLAGQLRDNLAKRKMQSRARNTRPRKFNNNQD